MDSSSQSSGLFRQKIALLIDFDNMILGIEDPGFDIEIVVNALRERGIMVLGRAYGDWYRHSRHRRRLMEQGIDLIETPVFGPIIKNSADMHMALDAFEIAHTQSHIDTFCIVSGDSDFLPLIKRLQTRDKTVIVIAGQKFTSELVRRNCNEYISYENLVAELMSAHEDVSVIEGAYHLLARAIDTLHERGVEVRSSALKQMMVQLNPMFSERTFGCSQFRHFLDRAARAGVLRMEGRDPHSGELLVSLIEDAEARPENRTENRADNRSERFDNRAEPSRDSRGALRSEPREPRDSREPRDRYERFDRYEPRDNRSDARSDRRESDKSEPSRAEARSEAPRAESRVESRPQPRVEERAEPILEPAREEAAPMEEAVAETEGAAVEGAAVEGAAVEGREGRRRRGGRGRTKAGAEEIAQPEAASDAPEAAAEEPQVLEGAPSSSDAPGDAPGEEEASSPFVDRNSQLGRVPLRRGRLRFSARLGRATAADEAPAATQEEQDAAPQNAAPEDAAPEDTPGEVPAEPQLFELPAPDAVAEATPEATSSGTAEASAEAEVEAEVEAEAKPKRRAPRRKSPRKKDADATPEAEAPAVEAPAVEAPAVEAAAEAAPAPEAPPVEAAPEPGVPEPGVPEPGVPEAPDEAPAEAAEPEVEASTKPKRPARRRTRKKAGDAASSDAASSDAAPEGQSSE